MFFSATRWVENQEPANRLISIWPNIKQLWNWWCRQKGKQPSSLTSKSILYVKAAIEDNLTTAKLHFFSFIAGKVQPFLLKYQTNKPMIPFMYHDLKLLITNLSRLFVKKDKVKTGKKLVTINLHDDANLLPLEDVEIGFAAEYDIKQMMQKDAISKSAIKEFRRKCVVFVRNMLEKIFERLPITSDILKCAAVFDPSNLVLARGTLMKIFKTLLTELVELKIISVSHGDNVLQEFSNFYDEERVLHLKQFKEYSEKDQRLDEFSFHDIGIGKYTHLSFVARLIFTVSHGQSAVERNFSLKNNLEQDNQDTNTIVARRICKDYMCAKKIKPTDIVVDKQLTLAVKNANAMYKQHLDEKKREKLERKVRSRWH